MSIRDRIERHYNSFRFLLERDGKEFSCFSLIPFLQLIHQRPDILEQIYGRSTVALCKHGLAAAIQLDSVNGWAGRESSWPIEVSPILEIRWYVRIQATSAWYGPDPENPEVDFYKAIFWLEKATAEKACADHPFAELACVAVERGYIPLTAPDRPYTYTNSIKENRAVPTPLALQPMFSDFCSDTSFLSEKEETECTSDDCYLIRINDRKWLGYKITESRQKRYFVTEFRKLAARFDGLDKAFEVLKSTLTGDIVKASNSDKSAVIFRVRSKAGFWLTPAPSGGMYYWYSKKEESAVFDTYENAMKAITTECRFPHECEVVVELKEEEPAIVKVKQYRIRKDGKWYTNLTLKYRGYNNDVVWSSDIDLSAIFTKYHFARYIADSFNAEVVPV